MKSTFKEFLSELLRDDVMAAAAELLKTTTDKLVIVKNKDEIINKGRSQGEKTFKSATGFNWVVRRLSLHDDDYVQIIAPDKVSSVYEIG